MEAQEAARNILEDAETRLRDLIQHEVGMGGYLQVLPLLEAARGVAHVREELKATTQKSRTQAEASRRGKQKIPRPKQVDGAGSTDSPTADSAPTSSSPSPPHSKEALPGDLQHSLKSQFPQFLRDDEVLVKLGWSKKNDAPYEHRAPRETVFFVARTIQQNLASGKWTFSMQDFLPFEMPDGDSIPSYQAYLTVAWLRDMDLVTREGRSEYKVTGNGWDEATLQAIWEQTPSEAIGVEP